MTTRARLSAAAAISLVALALPGTATAGTRMTVDRSFGGGIVDAGGLPSSVYRDGRVVTARAAIDAIALARRLPDGRLDPSFGSGGVARLPIPVTPVGGELVFSATALATTADGRILVAGSYRVRSPEEESDTGGAPIGAGRPVLAELGPNGGARWIRVGRELPEVADREESITTIALQGGRIILGGTGRQGFLVRLRADGRPDPSFGREGTVLVPGPRRPRPSYAGLPGVQEVVTLRGGGIVAVGSRGSRMMVLRLGPDGARDARFGGDGMVQVSVLGGHACPCFSTGEGVAPAGHGRLVVSGDEYAGRQAAFLLRLGRDGRLDWGFGRHGVVRAQIHGGTIGGAVTVGAGGRIFVAGSASAGRRDAACITVFAFTPAGSPDRTFFGDGVFNRFVGDLTGNVAGRQVPTLDRAGRLTVAAGLLLLRLRPVGSR
ncbi:MAG: hypothetical protein U0R71_15875 [Solirubrobacterales bacterium]